MDELNSRHRNLLSFFKSGGSIEVCTSFGRARNKVLFPNGQPDGFSEATMYSLYAWGYIKEREFFDKGLRYSKVTYNEKKQIQAGGSK